MKSLLLCFTICSVLGRIINVQGQDDSDSDSDSDSHNMADYGGDDLASGQEDISTRDAEVTGNQNGESSSSSSSSSSSTEIQEKLGNPMSAKQAYGPDIFEKRINERQEQEAQFRKEELAGDPADMVGQNEHIRQANFYDDLGRRSMPRDSKKTAAANDDYLTPEKAPPELVLLVAKESALLGPSKDADLASDFDQKKILRSGDYWNGVWKEEVKPKSAMRSGTQKKNLGSIKAKINEGTELYKVVSKMKEISPKLLYIINKQ